ncbi:macro domain-containing protein [Streptomyces sp. SID13031]|uniref:type II toxin-antitoxin system antitoxin DNA ADP-ribosyl glycohydrolase DarG n=1 Tax=Streptomyces sp. SID13031 TaxID=2706046 RepID=UPI0013CDB6D2|nr:macro domain-containing protein [Streptomyces sp. SID13031]NEA35323.1 Appr-1-p processing protein [Streptomyces sp. SID13031]
MITEAHGNLLAADADALINTVNTVGVMGKGIALQFRRAYPAMFKDYEQAAKAGMLQLGKMHVWPTGLMTGPRFIINFPTKGHWKARSRVADISAGLVDLVQVVRDLDIRSIAVPPLGCGNGGLRWEEVEPIIRGAFTEIPDVDVILFPPGEKPRASEMKSRDTTPKMTPGRAALIALIKRYSDLALANPSLIESQKLMYFLQEAGEPLRLNYQRHHYGPYADNLRHVLKVVEGHYLTGFGDGSTPVRAAEPIEVLPGADAAAQPVLAEHPETVRRIERVVELTEGFETPYGLELLATVHWVARTVDEARDDPSVVAREVRDWSPRKGRMFTPNHIQVAFRALIDRGWLDPDERTSTAAPSP